MDQILTIIRNREEVLFEGNVFAVSSVNDIGAFDILPDHANFICTIKENVSIHHTKDRKQEFKIESGVLRAKENKVEVYIGI